jgi:RNA polymerase sigma factor (sigma-70 family)
MWQKNTSLGGEPNAFPPTTQGIVSGLQGADGSLYRATFEEICRRYWKPVYVYLRAAWAKDNETAKDLTQAFFLSLTEGDTLKRFDPSRGKLRGYLKVLLRSFVNHEDRARAALKRGGGTAVVSLPNDTSGLERLLTNAPQVDPEAIFERVWRTDLVGRALEHLRARCKARGNEVAFQVFEAYDFVPDAERPTYKDLSDRFRLADHEIKTHLYRMREELREEIRSELAQGTLSERDLDDEWNGLFGR